MTNPYQEEYPFAREKHLIHIRGLQATLADRNRRIEELVAALAEAKSGALDEASREEEYRRGWKAGTGTISLYAASARNELGSLQSAAAQAYNGMLGR